MFYANPEVKHEGLCPCAVRGCRMRGKLLLLREHLLADGQGVVLDRCEGDALRVVHHEGARTRARAAVLGAVRRSGALRAPEPDTVSGCRNGFRNICNDCFNFAAICFFGGIFSAVFFFGRRPPGDVRRETSAETRPPGDVCRVRLFIFSDTETNETTPNFRVYSSIAAVAACHRVTKTMVLERLPLRR